MKRKILIYRDDVLISSCNVAKNKSISQVRQQAERMVNNFAKQDNDAIYRYEIEGFKNGNANLR